MLSYYAFDKEKVIKNDQRRMKMVEVNAENMEMFKKHLAYIFNLAESEVEMQIPTGYKAFGNYYSFIFKIHKLLSYEWNRVLAEGFTFREFDICPVSTKNILIRLFIEPRIKEKF